MADFFLEFLVTAWLELAFLVLPDSKKNSKRTVFVCKLIVAFVVLYVVAAFTAGAIILEDTEGLKPLGIFLLASSVLIFILQIVFGMIFYGRRRK